MIDVLIAAFGGAYSLQAAEFVCDLLETSPTNSKQVRHKLETACLEKVAVVEFGIRQARDASGLPRGCHCSGTWPLAAGGAGTGGRMLKPPGRYEGAARDRRKNYLFDRLRVSSKEFMSHVIFLDGVPFCSPLST
jgi:hypothetical protein